MNKQKITFFLIDDDEDDRELFQLALEETELNYEYQCASSCCDALEMLKNNSVKPDYIFLDLNMPQMSGRDCLMALKKNIALAKIPVIIFSTSNDPKDASETKEMGAVDFITKPARTSELTIILNNLKKIINQNS